MRIKENANMGVETSSSLRYLEGIIGTLLEAVITLDCMQENCVKEGLKRYNSMESFQRYEVYPAISAGMRVLKDASSSPEYSERSLREHPKCK